MLISRIVRSFLIGRAFCSSLYRPVDFDQMFTRTGYSKDLMKIHRASKIQQVITKGMLDQCSPRTPGILDAWERTPEMTVEYLRKHKLMLIRIEPDQYNEDEHMFVIQNRKLKGLCRRNEVFGQLFDFRAAGNLYHTIMSSWSVDQFKYLHYASFRRYYPGRPNDCFAIIEPMNIQANSYIGDNRFHLRMLIPAFNYVCYNAVPPCHLKVDISYVVPERPLFLGDIQNLMPRGCYIDPKRLGEQAFIVYQVDFMDKQTEKRVLDAIRKDGAKKKQQQKKNQTLKKEQAKAAAAQPKK